MDERTSGSRGQPDDRQVLDDLTRLADTNDPRSEGDPQAAHRGPDLDVDDPAFLANVHRGTRESEDLAGGDRDQDGSRDRGDGRETGRRDHDRERGENGSETDAGRGSASDGLATGAGVETPPPEKPGGRSFANERGSGGSSSRQESHGEFAGDSENQLFAREDPFESIPVGSASLARRSLDAADELILAATEENHAPSVHSVAASVSEDGSLLITQEMLLDGALDVDGDSLTAVNLSAPGGTLTANGDGTWTFEPDADWNGSLDLSYQVTDGAESVDNALNLTVDAVNDAPQVVEINATMAEDETLLITQEMLLAYALDIDGDSLSAVNLSAPRGSLTDNGDGTWTFDPDADWHGALDLSYQVTDGTTSVNNVLGLTVEESGKVLVGTPNQDTLTGGGGDDTIKGLGDDDTMVGGDGNDRFVIEGSYHGTDQMDGGAGHDVVQGGNYSDVIRVTNNLDNLQSVEEIDGGAGWDRVLGTDGSDNLDFSTGPALTSIERVDGGAGDDTIVGTDQGDALYGNTGDDSLSGGSGDDTFVIEGSYHGTDQMDGGAGHDVVQGGNYSDVIRVTNNLDNLQSVEEIDGGAGWDRVLGTDGSDNLDFSTGPALTSIERVDGGAGDDTIVGTDQGDALYGNTGDDSLAGGVGDDTFAGGNGDDSMDGGVGNDVADGGRGDDLFTFGAGDGTDIFIGGDGWADTIQVEGVTGGPGDGAGWTLQVDGGVGYTETANGLEFEGEASGVIQTADGGELTFQGVERIEW